MEVQGMLLQYAREAVEAVEHDRTITTREDAFTALRVLGLDDFATLLLTMPNSAYPKLSSLLPRMANDEIQRSWTGNCGLDLLRQSCNFVRSTAYHFAHLTGKNLGDARVLDYGCGYGRLLRLMYYLVKEHNLYGVDPWEQSLLECNKCGLEKNLSQSDYYPQALPVADIRFDLIYAFSVFTHTSERATRSAFRAIRRSIANDGMLVATIRPVEYWDQRADLPETVRQSAVERHRRDGFAFVPHDRPAIDGDIPYGETSMTFAWIGDNLPAWRLAGIDRSLDDDLQLYIFLTPR